MDLGFRNVAFDVDLNFVMNTFIAYGLCLFDLQSVRVVHDHFISPSKHPSLLVICKLYNDRAWRFTSVFELQRIERL
jgi:hypothetical protein